MSKGRREINSDLYFIKSMRLDGRAGQGQGRRHAQSSRPEMVVVSGFSI